MQNIVIVGVGALGSHLVQFLRNMDVKIRVIDFDRVEQKNTQSQFHSRNAVGKNKAQVLSQLMHFLFNFKLEVIPHKLNKDNTEQLLKGADLIIDCLDNAEARELVQNYARKNNVNCLHGALSANGDFGRVEWDESFIIDKETLGAATCENGEHLPFIVMTASFLAQAVKNFLTNGKHTNFQITPVNAIKF